MSDPGGRTAGERAEVVGRVRSEAAAVLGRVVVDLGVLERLLASLRQLSDGDEVVLEAALSVRMATAALANGQIIGNRSRKASRHGLIGMGQSYRLDSKSWKRKALRGLTRLSALIQELQ